MRILIAGLVFSLVFVLAGCGGGGSGDGGNGSASGDGDSGGGGTPDPVTHEVSAEAGAGGSFSPGTQSVTDGATTTFSVTADSGYRVDSVTGCGGSLSGNTYTTGAITQACTVSANFVPMTHRVLGHFAEPISTPVTVSIMDYSTEEVLATGASTASGDWTIDVPLASLADEALLVIEAVEPDYPMPLRSLILAGDLRASGDEAYGSNLTILSRYSEAALLLAEVMADPEPREFLASLLRTNDQGESVATSHHAVNELAAVLSHHWQDEDAGAMSQRRAQLLGATLQAVWPTTMDPDSEYTARLPTAGAYSGFQFAPPGAVSGVNLLAASGGEISITTGSAAQGALEIELTGPDTHPVHITLPAIVVDTAEKATGSIASGQEVEIQVGSLIVQTAVDSFPDGADYTIRHLDTSTGTADETLLAAFEIQWDRVPEESLTLSYPLGDGVTADNLVLVHVDSASKKERVIHPHQVSSDGMRVEFLVDRFSRIEFHSNSGLSVGDFRVFDLAALPDDLADLEGVAIDEFGQFLNVLMRDLFWSTTTPIVDFSSTYIELLKIKRDLPSMGLICTQDSSGKHLPIIMVQTSRWPLQTRLGEIKMHTMFRRSKSQDELVELTTGRSSYPFLERDRVYALVPKGRNLLDPDGEAPRFGFYFDGPIGFEMELQGIRNLVITGERWCGYRPDDDHGNTLDDATEVFLDSTTIGAIDYDRDVDVFRVHVPAPGGILTVSTRSRDLWSATQTRGWLLDYDGDVLKSDESATGHFTLEESVTGGIYYIIVRDGYSWLHSKYYLDVAFDPSSAIPNVSVAEEDVCTRHGMCGLVFSLADGIDAGALTLSVNWGDQSGLGSMTLQECLNAGICRQEGGGSYRIWHRYVTGDFNGQLTWTSDAGLQGEEVFSVVIDQAQSIELQAEAGDGTVTLTWPALPADQYDLCQSELPVSTLDNCYIEGGNPIDLDVGMPPHVASGLTNDQPYLFRVEGRFGHQRMGSNEATATPRSTAPPPILGIGPLNDTGITWSGHATDGNAVFCDPEHPVGQDCHYGRDAQAAAGTLAKVGHGSGGFDFTKLDENGMEMYALGFDEPHCVRDNVTGLVWEMKTSDPSHLRYSGHTYTWYDPNSPNGNPGMQNGGDCTGSPCDTNGFVQAVNVQGLCGASDWRMPTWREMQGIVNYGRHSPAIDTEYFPNTMSEVYWSGSPGAEDSYLAWLVDFHLGSAGPTPVSESIGRVRLVRDGP